MANIATQNATAAPATLAGKPVFIPAPRRKALMHPDIPALVARYIIGADNALIRPSDIRQSVATLKTGMGAAAGLESFVNGLAGIAARLAWGAITPDQAAGGLPDFSAWAIQEADKAIISRKGISAGLLRTLVADVVQRTAALPVRTAPAKANKGRTITAPAADVIETPAPAPAAVMDRTAALAELARMTRAVADAPINTRDAIPHALTEAEAAEAMGALAEAAEASARKAEAEAAEASARKAEAEARAMAELTAAGQSAHAQAVAFCRLADAIGIKLTEAQLATLDAFEGRRAKLAA